MPAPMLRMPPPSSPATLPEITLDLISLAAVEGGPPVVVRTDENRILWDKLSFLAPFALVTTMYGVPVGVVRAEHNDELQAVITEVTSVAQATGAAVEPAPIRTAFANLPDGMKSSMLRDAEAGNPIEVDAIGGAIVRAADKLGIDVPATRRLVETLLRR